MYFKNLAECDISVILASQRQIKPYQPWQLSEILPYKKKKVIDVAQW